jgi:hypothetical protein
MIMIATPQTTLYAFCGFSMSAMTSSSAGSMMLLLSAGSMVVSSVSPAATFANLRRSFVFDRLRLEGARSVLVDSRTIVVTAARGRGVSRVRARAPRPIKMLRSRALRRDQPTRFRVQEAVHRNA